MTDPDNWWEGKRVLLTGGLGFLGRWIIKRLCYYGCREAVIADLQRDVDVTLSQLTLDAVQVLNVSMQEADVRDDSIMDLIQEVRPHVIIHLAGVSHINQSQGLPFLAFDVNVTGTINVMRGAALVKNKNLYPPHVIVASSNHVYGSHPGMSARTEESPMNQMDCYGASKHCADVSARALGLALHIPTVALRHVNAYGPENPHKTHITNAAILAAIKGEPLRLRGDGSARKDYLYVSDVADAYLALAKHACDLNVIGRAFNAAPNISTTEPTPSVLEWVHFINAVAEQNRGLKPQPPISLPAGQGEQSGYYERLDSSELRKWTGWWTRVSPVEGIERTIDYWLTRA